MSFSHQCWLMVFHWSLSDCKSPRVSRTLFSILAALSNAIVWIVSPRPPISNPSSPLLKLSGIFPSTPIRNGVHICLMFHSFLVLKQGLYTCLSFHFLWFSISGPLEQQSPQFSRFSFFLSLFFFFFFFFFANYYLVWSSCWDQVICLNFKIPKNFMRLILQDGFWLMHISKLATLVEDDPKAPFSKATTPRYRGGRYSVPRIAPLYPWSSPYCAGC